MRCCLGWVGSANPAAQRDDFCRGLGLCEGLTSKHQKGKIYYMRTTLTIETDVERMLGKVRREKQMRLKEVVNRALRAGLLDMQQPQVAKKPILTRCVDLGRCRMLSLDSVVEALAFGEGEAHT